MYTHTVYYSFTQFLGNIVTLLNMTSFCCVKKKILLTLISEMNHKIFHVTLNSVNDISTLHGNNKI